VHPPAPVLADVYAIYESRRLQSIKKHRSRMHHPRIALYCHVTTTTMTTTTMSPAVIERGFMEPQRKRRKTSEIKRGSMA